MGSPHQEEKRLWGRSNPCPRCGGQGYLDRIDLIDRVMFEHCVDCGFKYEEREDSLSLLFRD